jgi:transposase
MITYSLDLRQRIISTVERGKQTKRDIAAFFDVHESFIYKLLRQQRELGHIEPLPHGGGAIAVIKEKHRTVLTDLVAETPDATLDELRTGLRKKTRLNAGISTLWRALDELNLTVKKKRSVPPKQTPKRAPNLRSGKSSSPSKA